MSGQSSKSRLGLRIHSCRGTLLLWGQQAKNRLLADAEHCSLNTQQVPLLTHNNASLWVFEVLLLFPTSTILVLCSFFPPFTFHRAPELTLTFWLEEASCSRLVPGSVPPIHFTKSLLYNPFPSLFAPRKNTNDKMILASSVLHWCRALQLKCLSEPKAWAWLNFKQAKHQLFWLIDPGDQANHKRLK